MQILLLLVCLLVPGVVQAEAGDAPQLRNVENKLSDLEERIARTQRGVDEAERVARTAERSVEKAASYSAVAFLYGAFCALWAQNTNRSAWLWFFLGAFFSFVTVIVLLWKHAADRKERTTWTDRPAPNSSS